MDWNIRGSTCDDVSKLLDFDVGCNIQFTMIHGDFKQINPSL